MSPSLEIDITSITFILFKCNVLTPWKMEYSNNFRYIYESCIHDIEHERLFEPRTLLNEYKVSGDNSNEFKALPTKLNDTPFGLFSIT